MNFNYGSFWRRWDLHVHTPLSILNNQYGGNAEGENTFRNYFRLLVKKAIENNIAVIGVTDYFNIQGYSKIVGYMNDDKLLKEIFLDEIHDDGNYLNKVKQLVFFPNIEFRLNDTLRIEDKNKQSKLQIHVILSNTVSVEKIQNELLCNLHCNYGDKTYILNDYSIEEYGKKLISEGIGDINNNNPLKRGYEGLFVNLDELIKTLSSSFQDEYLIVGVEEDVTKYIFKGQGGPLRRKYLTSCDGIFTSNINSINWFSSNDCFETIGAFKPCIWGSDAHSFETMFNPAGEKYCWIKADTTFLGLKAAFNAITDRIFIGKVPQEYNDFSLRANYTIKSVKINNLNEGNITPKWFNMPNEMILNPYMVSIIGNKGSGKSALADIISYLGNSYKMEYASFLNEKRFLSKKTKYYNNFGAYFRRFGKENNFFSKDTLEMINKYDPNSPERVQFLPQNYIESVCNDLNDEFQKEIDQVIYSYIPLEDKLDSNNLNDLIEIKTKYIINNIKQLQVKLSEVNYNIISLLNMKSNIYINEVKKKKVILMEKLVNHDNNKPQEVKKPDDLQKDKASQLNLSLSEYCKSLYSEIDDLKNKINDVKNKLQLIFNYEQEIKFFDDTADNLNSKYRELLGFIAGDEKISNEEKYILIKYNETKLKNKKDLLLQNFKDYSVLLDSNFDSSNLKIEQTADYDFIINESRKYSSLYGQLFVIESYIKSINDQTSESTRLYLEYIKNINKWVNDRKMILGEIPNPEDGESIKKCDDELEYISNKLPNDLDSLKAQRNNIILSICSEKNNLKNEYQKVYSPIQNKIDSLLNTDDDKIEFNVLTTYDKKLIDNILSYMNRRVSSLFMGNEGLKRIVEYMNGTDFSDNDSILHFINQIINDVEKTDNLYSFIPNLNEFLNYICGLDYLNVNYSLTLGRKVLNELSPGERGIVLLVFYLALSKSNLPLIIDQPEDNLDNQSVYTKLVPCIKRAKKNRQIIVVTHNPNIAVACDSEQIIYTHMNKDTMEITYETGSLENPVMRNHVVNILEGTIPAFNMRKIKYFDGYKKE